MLIEQISRGRPAEINGIIGGYTGEGAKTVIAQATAKISFRLVGAQDPEKIRDAFAPSCARACRPTPRRNSSTFAGSPALELPYDNPALGKARAALTEEWGTKAVAVGSGGSIPIVGDFKNVLGMDTLLVGFGLDDDRVHSPNEKYDLTSFHKGTRLGASSRRWRVAYAARGGTTPPAPGVFLRGAMEEHIWSHR